MQEQAKDDLLKHELSENRLDIPWLLLCPQDNSKRRILCLGVTDDDIFLLKSLSTYFNMVFSCTFGKLSCAPGEIPSNIIRAHLDKNASVLPYDTGLFDIAVICNFSISKKRLSVFFSEIHRILRPEGYLFFCFSNSLSRQRVKQLLCCSDNIKSPRPLSILSCKESLTKSGFSLPHFYTFSPGCTKLCEIRDCNKPPQFDYLRSPFVSVKRVCAQFLKNTKLVRNYLATHYGVVASKKEGVSVRALPALIADEMRHKFLETSWHVWGDSFDVTGKGTFVFKLYDKKEQTRAICKIPLNFVTRKHLEANYSALENIHTLQNISDDVKAKIPLALVRSEINDYFYFVEELKEGVPAVQYRHVRQVYDDILYASSKVITAIHHGALFENACEGKRLLTAKVESLSKFLSSEETFIYNLEAFLHDSFQNHVLFVIGKGDCSANNIIVNQNKEVSGIIDWDQSQTVSFPMVDIINLIESFRRNVENKSMGKLIVEQFLEGKRSVLENTILKEYCTCLSLQVDDFIPFAVLYWIDHIIAQDFVSVCNDNKWMQNNVMLVVRYLKKYF